MPIDYTAPLNNALRNWVDSARTGYLVRQDQADRQNAMAKQQLSQQEFDLRRKKYETETATALRDQQQKEALINAMSLAAQGRQVTVPGFEPPPISGNFGEFDTGGWALPETTQTVPYSYEEQVGLLAPYLGPEKYLETIKPEKVGYTFNPDAGVLVPNVPGLPVQPVQGFTPTRKDQFIDWGHGQKRNIVTGEIVRVPTAPSSGQPTLAQLKFEQAKEDREAKKQQRQDQAIASADNVINTVDEALGIVDASSAGLGSVLSKIPMTDARELQAKLTTIKANIGFDRLQQMRESSPTGGALGQVAVQELESLQATIASLDQAQSPQTLRNQLGKIKEHYQNWRNAVRQSQDASSEQPSKKTTVPRPARAGYKWQQNTETGEFREVPVRGR